MQFLKFFLGIVLIQAMTTFLLLVIPNFVSVDEEYVFVRLALPPLLLTAVVLAFWFSSISSHAKKDALYREKEQHNKEREKLQVNAERAKTRVMKQAQKDIAREAKTAHAKANFKVGVAVASAVGVGLLFVVAQMFTVGLLIFSVAGGVAGGYYWRGKRQIAKGRSYVEIENASGRLPTPSHTSTKN